MRDIFTLENLAESRLLQKPAKLAVLGFPVAHSASPQLHQPALDEYGIGCSYIRLQVEPGRLKEAFERMQNLGFIGCNVTIPHKFEALEACDEIDPSAAHLGAVNTVVFGENGSRGFNTDGPGIEQAVHGAFGLMLGEIHVVILGAGGGAGQAIAAQCALSQPAKLTLVNRSLSKIMPLAKRLGKISLETKILAINFEDSGLREACHEGDLLIQTTSLGLRADDLPVLAADCFLPHHCAYDTIYQPAETPFLASARATGCRAENGLSLLIQQGALAFQLWFPGSDPLPLMRRAMAAKLG